MPRAELYRELERRPYSAPPGWEAGPRLVKYPTEDVEGRLLVADLEAMGCFVAHIPNEEQQRAARRRKREQGTRPGFPDYLVITPRPFQVGARWRDTIYIELKRDRRASWKVSGQQLATIMSLRDYGQLVEVCWGRDHARRVVECFMGGMA